MACVLVVDDDDGVREVVQAVLETRGHEMVGVATAPAALEAAGGRKFDVALVDLKLRGEDGLDVARQVAATGTRVVLMTGVDLEEKDLGFPVLRKPFRVEALVAALK